MPDWTIRNCRPGDLPRLHEIDLICFPPGTAYSRSELRFYVNHPAAVARVAEDGEKILGFAVGIARRDAAGHVITLDVVPEARRRGIGRALMDVLHAEFIARGCELSILEVAVENLAARRFYEDLGYTYDTLLRGYYAGKVDAYRMARPMGTTSDRA